MIGITVLAFVARESDRKFASALCPVDQDRQANPGCGVRGEGGVGARGRVLVPGSFQAPNPQLN